MPNDPLSLDVAGPACGTRCSALPHYACILLAHSLSAGGTPMPSPAQRHPPASKCRTEDGDPGYSGRDRRASLPDPAQRRASWMGPVHYMLSINPSLYRTHPSPAAVQRPASSVQPADACLPFLARCGLVSATAVHRPPARANHCLPVSSASESSHSQREPPAEPRKYWEHRVVDGVPSMECPWRRARGGLGRGEKELAAVLSGGARLNQSAQWICRPCRSAAWPEVPLPLPSLPNGPWIWDHRRAGGALPALIAAVCSRPQFHSPPINGNHGEYETAGHEC